METKQTAVEWIESWIVNIDVKLYSKEFILGILKEAKQKERKQMIAFAMNLTTIDLSKTGRDILMDEAQQLYKNLYGK